MSRPKKKEISLNKDSILSLLQEIYNELVEQRSTAIRVQNKMLALLKDPEDMTVIGPVLEKQQKIINDVVEKKLTLAKLQSTIWEKSNNKEDDKQKRKNVHIFLYRRNPSWDRKKSGMETEPERKHKGREKCQRIQQYGQDRKKVSSLVPFHN